MPMTLEQYYAELKKKFYISVEQQAFADSIKALNDYTASMRKPDKYGRIPFVTAAQKKRVMELHADIAKFGGELLANEESYALKDIVKKISALANQNLAVVAGYDPAREKKTLDTLEEEARTLTLDLRGSELPKEKVGNALSTRQITVPQRSELLAAYEQFYEQMRQNELLPFFQLFFHAVKAADDAMSALHRRDKYGRIPLLRGDQRDELVRLHEALGKEAEALIAGDAIPEEHKDAVRKLAALGSANLRHLRNYDPAQPSTLPELLETVRTLTLDTRGTELKDKLGSAQNSRQPLTFLDDTGREITGVFTPRKDSDIWDRWDRSFRKGASMAKKLSPEGKEILEKLMDRMGSPEGARVLGVPEDADRGTRLGAFYSRVMQKYKTTAMDELYKVIAELSSTPEKPLTAEEVKAALGKAVGYVGKAMDDDSTAILNNNIIARIHDGARIDSRNAAMSAVAELLNVPKLLAKSVPMKIIDKDGREIEGTFMREAEGVDVSNIRDEDGGYGSAALKDHDGRGLKSIADLQVLDFICGNTDRHDHNVVYQFDKETEKFIGVQGYDNDTAFGTLIPKEGEFVAHLNLPENMLAVSQSMYERLKQISPEMLKFTLRGYGLSEEELNAAAQRMQIVKDTVEKDLEYYQTRDQDLLEGKPVTKPEKYIVGKHCRLVPDQDFKKVKWEDLGRKVQENWYREGKPVKEELAGNFFTRAFQTVKSIYRMHRKQKEAYKSLKSAVAIGSDNRANPKGAEIELDRARQLEAELNNRTKRFHSSSNYEKMQTAVKNYRVFLENLHQRLDNAGKDLKMMDAMIIPREDAIPRIMDSVVTLDDLNEMQRLSKQIKTAAETYLNGKDPNQPYEAYTQNRIDAAQVVKTFGENGSRFSEAETETVERNQHRAQEEINRRFGDVLEAEGWTEPKQPEPQPQPHP